MFSRFRNRKTSGERRRRQSSKNSTGNTSSAEASQRQSSPQGKSQRRQGNVGSTSKRTFHKQQQRQQQNEAVPSSRTTITTWPSTTSKRHQQQGRTRTAAYAIKVVNNKAPPPSRDKDPVTENGKTNHTVSTYIDGTTEDSFKSGSSGTRNGVATTRSATTNDSSALDIPSLQRSDASPALIAEEIAIDGSFRYFVKGRFLGQGGFSNVYECVQQGTEDHYAIKIVPKEKRSLEMLEMEVSIQRSLKHPNICACMRLFWDSNNTYVVLEVCQHRSMDRLLQHQKRLEESEAKRYFYQLTSAVAFMQASCVLHRDLKAANLFLDANFQLKVGDYGLARQLESPKEFRTTRCGTPNYMAPEIIRGTRETRHYGLEIDVWSLGIILYLLLAGKLPFEAQGDTRDNEETYRKILSNDYRFPMRLFHNVSAEAQDLIRSILKTEASMRPSASRILLHAFFRQRNDMGDNDDDAVSF